MKIKSFIIVLLLFFTCISVTGCMPDSRRTVERKLDSILNVKYKYISSTREEDAFGNNDKNYYFEDENGVSFYVSSGYYTNYMGFRTKGAFCDYVTVLFDAEKETVDKAIESDFPTEWFPYAFGMNYEIEITEFAELEQVAAVVEKALNSIQPFPINRDKYYAEYGKLPYILIKRSGDKDISSFYFLCDGEPALTRAQILDELQYKYIDRVRRGGFEEELPDEAVSKHKISAISSVYLDGKPLDGSINGYRYYFDYNSSLDDYVTINLDLCQDFDDFPYNYGFEGAFSNLVELLGGTYECDDWKAKWTIGQDTWTATLETQKTGRSEYEYLNMTIYKNGEELNLSEMDLNNWSVSGRAFSLSDMEQMLGITAEVNQSEVTINLLRK